MIRWLAPAILLLALSACDRGEREADGENAVPLEEAASLFQGKCAICHGERGDGRGPRRASLYAKPPDFRRSSWRAGKSLAASRAVIREGRPGSDMPAWKSLEAAEVAGLAEYVLWLGETSAARGEAPP